MVAPVRLRCTGFSGESLSRDQLAFLAPDRTPEQDAEIKRLANGLWIHHVDVELGRMLIAYVIDRKPPVDWVVGLLANELECVARNFVDISEHTVDLFDTVQFVQNFIPYEAQGSREKVARWLFPEAFR